ncbi:glycosyltransferase family 4 protein [Acinetobacter sp. MD2(2019)]|uniref:glycosyltransferase family 4 protein n=1 Tax=Acinetobacter sp. MD2(2019) TaxID=2605273 RepID=UPI002D1EDE37|nr:glycosyltransferase family 4 protein [Acinetobacter sp. MD2(2019)]MEB3754424.1 glycosyltransferase family 4 protein [Acinetobacter sp. MD2(2019)]
MKFCIISNDLHSVRNFRGDLLNEIAARGYAVHIIAPNIQNHPKDAAHFQKLGFQLHAFSMQKMGTNPIADTKTILDLYRILKQIQPQKVLSYTIKPVMYGSIAAYFAKVPERYLLLSGLGFAFQQDNREGGFKYIKKFFDQVFHFALSKASRVIFQNADDLALIQSLGHLNNIPTAVVNGSGVDVEKFAVAPLVLSEQQQPKPIFLMVARLLKDKGILEYIAAARQVKRIYPKAEFHLVGFIDANPKAIRQAELDAWIAEDLIHYWGKLDDVRVAIAQANVFVLPSYREGIPRSVLEAMSMARAIITTDAPGCKETVVEGHNGFKVPVKNADALANAMQHLIVEPAQIQSMAMASRHIILEKYDVKKVNEEMLWFMKLCKI